MKNLKATAFFLLLLCYAGAQTITSEKTESGNKVSFCFAKEINVAYYVIEAANDTLQFDIIGNIKPQGYSNHSAAYQFTNYDEDYAWYEVKQIDMSGSCTARLRIAGHKVSYSPQTGPRLTATGDNFAH